MPRPATFGTWTELRPGHGRQPDPGFYAERLEEAVLADQLGLAAVWGSEHHAVEDGHLSQQLPWLAAVAARTSRARLGTGVLLLPLYRPREVAEQAGVVDLLAGGRLILGLGGGWVEREFDAFGVDRSRRGRLLEEKLGVLRRALAEGMIADSPDGTDLPVGPRSPQAGGPPLYLGGTAPKALDRVARLADGWFALAHYRWQKTAEAWPVLAEALERAGRPAGGFPVVAGVTCGSATTPSAPGPPSWPRPSATSSTGTATGPPTATSPAPTRSTPAASSARPCSATPPRGSWPPWPSSRSSSPSPT